MKENMRFEHVYRNTAADLWQISMYYMYGSMVGVCNIIFTAAVFILTAVRFPGKFGVDEGGNGIWMLPVSHYSASGCI